MLKNKKLSKIIIHFIGIGGIGMSGIAEIMENQGYSVQGSDISINNNIKRLERKKIKVFIKHKKSNLKNVNVVVYSSAIKKNNPEIIHSKKLSIPILSRAEMLAELMRNKKSIAVAGSHGKTTTTSIIGSILEYGKKDPTIVNGGIINSLSNNNRLGLGNLMVVEADESDGSFLKLPHEINVITNIDCEHLDYYKNLDNLLKSFKKFILNLPFYGYSIICINNKNSKKISKLVNERKIITYDIKNAKANININNISNNTKKTTFNLNLKKGLIHHYSGTYSFELNLLGNHNVLNASAAIIVGMLNKISISNIQKSLTNFQGVKRRFTFLGKIKNSSIYDDYAHHPVEIKSSYEIAKLKSKKRIIVIFQPHRYSRTKDLYSDFLQVLKKIDILFLCKIYSAGEKKIKNIDSLNLYRDIKKNNLKEVFYIKNEKMLNKFLPKFFKEGNLIVFMGAGSITNWANKFINEKKI